MSALGTQSLSGFSLRIPILDVLHASLLSVGDIDSSQFCTNTDYFALCLCTNKFAAASSMSPTVKLTLASLQRTPALPMKRMAWSKLSSSNHYSEES